MKMFDRDGATETAKQAVKAYVGEKDYPADPIDWDELAECVASAIHLDFVKPAMDGLKSSHNGQIECFVLRSDLVTEILKLYIEVFGSHSIEWLIEKSKEHGR